MPKALITTKAGTKITIEGKPDEVSLIVQQLQTAEVGPQGRRQPTARAQRPAVRRKATPTNLILWLIEDGFFKEPKDLMAVKAALEEKGHYYPATTLSPSLLRLVRRHAVRRIKKDQKWLYTL